MSQPPKTAPHSDWSILQVAQVSDEAARPGDWGPPDFTRRRGHVFLSYKREECKVAAVLRNELQKCGFRVWWDEDIQCGQVWSGILDEAVKEAGAIVVLWSTQSTRSRWVMHEASCALDRDIYAPVRIELCKIEPPYDRVQATDLFDWRGDAKNPGFLDLVRHLDRLVPAPKKLSTRAREWSWRNRFSIASIGFAAAALVLLLWQVRASRNQLAQMQTLISEQRTAATELQTLRKESEATLTTLIAEQAAAARLLGTLRAEAEATEEVSLERHERTLRSLWIETNQLSVGDVIAQVRFIFSSPIGIEIPEKMFEDNWDLMISARKRNEPTHAKYPTREHGLRYYDPTLFFKYPTGLSLQAYEQTVRPIKGERVRGQFSTFRLLRHHYVAGGDLDRWRAGHEWNGAVIDAIWALYEVPDWLAVPEAQPADALTGPSPQELRPIPLRARLVVYVRGLAIGKSHGSAVALGDRIVVRFPEIFVANDAFTEPPFEAPEVEP